MHGLNPSEQLAPVSLPEGFGFFRALWLCIVFDLVLDVLITGVWRCVH